MSVYEIPVDCDHTGKRQAYKDDPAGPIMLHCAICGGTLEPLTGPPPTDDTSCPHHGPRQPYRNEPRGPVMLHCGRCGETLEIAPVQPPKPEV